MKQMRLGSLCGKRMVTVGQTSFSSLALAIKLQSDD